MFHQQQNHHLPPPSSSWAPTYYPPQPHIVNPDPSSLPSYPQPVLPPGVAAEPALHPPGTDPYSNSAAVPPTYVGLEAQPQYYHDPAVVSLNWAPQQVDPVGCAFTSFLENQLVSSCSNSLRKGNWATQPFGPKPFRTKLVKTKFAQPVRCEVCKIDCNSKDVFDKHAMGKKHKKNLEMQNSYLTPDVPAASKGLKTKKRKLIDGSMEADSARVCTVCNVVCNSQEVFDKHLSGKKHAAQATLTTQNPFAAAVRTQYDGSLMKKQKKVVQFAWCEVCKISCNSNEIYAKHLIGKKHLKNVVEKEKSDDAGASNALPLATNPIIGPLENPAANNPGSDDIQKTQKSSTQPPEDLETKKRKVVESGTAADSVRTCTVCNVVCNSQRVYDSHLSGQKHAAMMKKQGLSGMSVLVPSLVAALPN